MDTPNKETTPGTSPAPRRVKPKLVVDWERCKGCGFCVEFCPKEALDLSGDFNRKGYHPPVVDDAKCVGCNICELICPEFSIFCKDAEGAPARKGKEPKKTHLAEPLLRMDRMPHIWCPGCGIGTTVNCFTVALSQCGIPREKIGLVSGIGCTGRVAGYVNLDSFHTTHGRAIPFATGLALGNPDMKVVVYSGDGDLTAIGGNHFIHAARRNMNLTVILVNNFIYGMTGGQTAPTTPIDAKSSTSPYGASEPPFNLAHLAETCGATYVARWTALHTRQLTRAMQEALNKKGFSFIEIIAPCPTLFLRLNKLGDGLSMMRFFRDNSEIQNGADTRSVAIPYQGKIVLGKFVDKEEPTWLDRMNNQMSKALGTRHVPYGAPKKEGEAKS